MVVCLPLHRIVLAIGSKAPHFSHKCRSLERSFVCLGDDIGGLVKTYLEQAPDDGEDNDGEDRYYDAVREYVSMHERAWKGQRESIPAPGIEGGDDGLDHFCGIE